VQITAAEFFNAERAGRDEGGEYDPLLEPYQIMWRDRDRRRPSARRRAIPVPHWVYIARDGLPAVLSKPATKAGRKPSYDWSAVECALIELMDEHGDFVPEDHDWNGQARLEEALQDRFGMAEATVRERIPEMLLRWRKAKAGN
jgi:hypothetical protein